MNREMRAMKTWRICTAVIFAFSAATGFTTQANGGCGSGWYPFSGSCYQLKGSAFGGGWGAAQTLCDNDISGASIAEVTSRDEADFIKNLMKTLFVGRVWIGGAKENSFSATKWDSTDQDVSLSYVPGANNLGQNNFGCLSMRDDGSWEIVACASHYPYVCELGVTLVTPMAEAASSAESTIERSATTPPTEMSTTATTSKTAPSASVETTVTVTTSGAKASLRTCSEYKSNFCISVIRTIPEIGLGSMIHVTTVASVSSCMSLCCPGECQAFSYNNNGTCVIYDDVNPTEPLFKDDWSFYLTI